jgi:predicted enzyme related to lactoylglutathione lyase
MINDKSQKNIHDSSCLEIFEIVGINIWTNNLNIMREFYENILELSLHSDHGNFIAFNIGASRLNIGLHDKVTGHNGDSFRNMINLGVRDIFFVVERLTKKNVTFIRQPEKESWGGWVATFYDPDRNILQLLQKA